MPGDLPHQHLARNSQQAKTTKQPREVNQVNSNSLIPNPAHHLRRVAGGMASRPTHGARPRKSQSSPPPSARPAEVVELIQPVGRRGAAPSGRWHFRSQPRPLCGARTRPTTRDLALAAVRKVERAAQEAQVGGATDRTGQIRSEASASLRPRTQARRWPATRWQHSLSLALLARWARGASGAAGYLSRWKPDGDRPGQQVFLLFRFHSGPRQRVQVPARNRVQYALLDGEPLASGREPPASAGLRKANFSGNPNRRH